MMSFCKKSVNSFLGLSLSPTSLDKDKNFPPLSAGLGLVTASAGESLRSLHVIQSAAVKLPSPPPSAKKDICFIDDIGGGVDGWMSCTESLGFESSDERRVDDKIEDLNVNDGCFERRRMKLMREKRRREKRVVKSYPPPIPSLNQNGQPSFVLLPVRRDGRLELTEVRIERPEILRASREDGRLKLHLVREEDFVEREEDDEEKEERAKVGENEAEEEKVEEFKKFQVNGGEGLRRCHELVNRRHHHSNHHHHPHNLHVWNQHCVATR